MTFKGMFCIMLLGSDVWFLQSPEWDMDFITIRASRVDVQKRRTLGPMSQSSISCCQRGNIKPGWWGCSWAADITCEPLILQAVWKAEKLGTDEGHRYKHRPVYMGGPTAAEIQHSLCERSRSSGGWVLWQRFVTSLTDVRGTTNYWLSQTVLSSHLIHYFAIWQQRRRSRTACYVLRNFKC